jgi:hypothetical protein
VTQIGLLTELDVLLLFFPMRLFELIATNTDMSIDIHLASAEISESRKKQTKNWSGVVLSDIVRFFGIHIAMTAVKVPSWKLYWSTKKGIALPNMADTMVRLRYELIRNWLTVVARSQSCVCCSPGGGKGCVRV